MGIGQAIDANPAITAGAVVGGAYLGDKMSPLSDTTNIAAISAEVDLYSHIRSMVNTTVPSALLAALVYAGLGFAYPAKVNYESMTLMEPTLQALSRLFDFHILCLLPVAVVVLGAVFKKPTVPVLVLSSLTGGLLGYFFQGFSLQSVVQCLYKGFDLEMAFWADNIPESVGILLDRGGLYQLNDPIVITIMVFIFIGTLEVTNAMSITVDRLFRFAKSRRTAILSVLAAGDVGRGKNRRAVPGREGEIVCFGNGGHYLLDPAVCSDGGSYPDDQEPLRPHRQFHQSLPWREVRHHLEFCRRPGSRGIPGRDSPKHETDLTGESLFRRFLTPGYSGCHPDCPGVRDPDRNR